MQNDVVLALDSLDPDSWEYFENVGNLGEFLQTKFSEFPKNTKIYHEDISGQCDVTPWDEGSVEELFKLSGKFHVISYPLGLETMVIVSIILSVVSVAAAIFLRPKAPPGLMNQQTNSPNNGLSNRSNQVRLGSRIPDIYGTVNSMPDLLSAYTVYENNIEVEYAYMCIGRGYYTINPGEIYDNVTPVGIASPSLVGSNTPLTELAQFIPGTSVCIYDPYTSPNTNGTIVTLPTGGTVSGGPSVTVPPTGYTVAPLYTTNKCTSVNGQVLRAPGSGVVQGASNITIGPGGVLTIQAVTGVTTPSFDLFQSGDLVNLSGAVVSTSASPVYSTQSLNIIIGVPSTNGPLDPYINITFVGSTVPTGFGVGTDVQLSASFTFPSGLVNVGGNYLVINVNSGNEITLKWESGSPGPWMYERAGATSNAQTTGVYGQYASADTNNLGGNYLVTSVTDSGLIMTLDISAPGANPNWTGLTTTTGLCSPSVTNTTDWEGPFVIATNTATIAEVFSNFVAEQGMYMTNGTSQYATSVTVNLGITPIDKYNNVLGAEVITTFTLNGSATLTSLIAGTLQVAITPSEYLAVRACRTTPKNTTFAGTVVDEVRWAGVMGMTPLDITDFGNVTTVQSVTQATTGALSVKDRKLNMDVTRNLATWTGSGTTMTTALTPVTDFANILYNICLDPLIGNCTPSEIDFAGISATYAQMDTYFGSNLATQFCYTFDNAGTSFEEAVAIVANAVFCSAYRRGNLISVTFEQKNEASSMLFNHRNKLPKSETRAVRFGIEKDYDGVELTWVDPVDNTTQTFYIWGGVNGLSPVFGSMASISPHKIQTLGVRNGLQAYFTIWRDWNKIAYQNTTVEFEAMQESDLLLLTDRIQVTDSTRTGTCDGEIVSQSGLTLTLSQPVNIADSAGLTMFLQYPDETVDSIGVTVTSNPYVVTLARAPTQSLVLNLDAYVNTLYIITGNSSVAPRAYLVTERSPQAKMTNKITCINYTDSYYTQDTDFINGNVDDTGTLI